MSSDNPPPKVSVVLTAYNRPQFLPAAIDSVLAQTLADFELIIVDDGSTDSRVRAVLQEYAGKDKRIKPFHKENAGASAARNYGIAKACAPYIAIMDDDDISLPTRLEKQHEFLQAHPNIAAVSCLYGTLKNNQIHNPPSPQKTMVNVNATAMIRHTICGDAPYRPWFLVVGDLDLTLRLREKHQLAQLPEVLYTVRLHDEGHLSTSAKWFYYNAACRISANNRKLGRADIIDQNATMEEVICDGFPHYSEQERKSLLWGFRKPAKHLLRTREYGKLRRLITLCEQIATPTEQATLKHLKTRINLWAITYARLGYFTTTPANSSDSIV